jgi:outer membrane protein assembly factor BamA
MLSRQPVSVALFAILVLAAVAPGCLTPKKYQPGKPFVFSTDIDIQGNLPPSEKADLKNRLTNQLDDSLKTKVVTVFPLIKTLVKPPAFDTNAVVQSVHFMNALLYSLGYYKATITWDSTLTLAKKGQQRVSVSFAVKPGKSYKFDSIGYQLQDSALQSLAVARRAASLLKKGEPYSVEAIATELDRLVELFRNTGYYKFTKDDLLAERDTVFAALIDPSLDPFERLQLLKEAEQRQQKPTMNVVIKLRGPENTSHFRQYRIRSVNIYPDLDLLEDSTPTFIRTDTVRDILVHAKYNKFKPSFVVEQCTLRPGDIYKLRNYVRTYSNYSQLNVWSQVAVDFREAGDSTPNLDVTVKMYPLTKQDISVTLDASYNTGDVIAAGNLFGTGINFGLNNRNVAKQAIQSSTNFRTGVELGKDFIQTFQANLSHTISLPKFILPFRVNNTDSLLSHQTQFNFNAGYTERRDFYLLRSLNASWSYNWSRRVWWKRNTHSWFYSPLNVEYVALAPGKKLDSLIKNIPNLKYSFNTGLVISQVIGYNFLHTSNNKKTMLLLRLEESGGLFGLFTKLDKNANLYRFVKWETQYTHYIDYPKSGFAFRLYGGVGIPYGKDETGFREKQLPFFKAFYAGGPYSMKAWQVRQLGPGSSVKLDTLNGGGIDRFGDIKLEGNIEYRFNVGTIFGVKLKSALYTDVGNIWYRNNIADPELNGAVFRLSKLYQDIAVGAGTSLRFDFDYFLIRLDWGYKIKNPVYADINNGWFQHIQLLKGQFQLGIGYPF